MLDAVRIARDGLAHLVLLPIVWVVVSLAVVYPMLWLLRWFESPLARWMVCLTPPFAFLAIRGTPNLVSALLIGVAAVWTHRFIRRSREDRQDVDAFVFDENCCDIAVSPGFLQTFPAPLWNKLGLNGIRHTYGLHAIEGMEDGHHFMVLELAHEGWGLIRDHDSELYTSFFIVAIPKAQQGRVMGWRPADFEVSVDDAFVYLARPGKKVRPRDWQSLINTTIRVVESLRAGA